MERDGVHYFEDTPVITKTNVPKHAEAFLVDRAKLLQCNIRDISMRKKAENALKESEARFKAIFKESMDGMFLAEAGTRRFFMCNPIFCQMLRYTEEELTRMTLDDITPKKDLPFVLARLERLSKGEIKLGAGFPLKRNDDSIIYADVNASQITLLGKKYLMGSFRDITESKILQDELKERMQDLERFSKFAVDRELRMEELEKKLKELQEKLKSA